MELFSRWFLKPYGIVNLNMGTSVEWGHNLVLSTAFLMLEWMKINIVILASLLHFKFHKLQIFCHHIFGG